MNEKTIPERVKDVMGGLFSMGAADITADSSIETVEQWDSLQHVNLMMALEQEFSIRIDIADAVEMTSFPIICETIARYTGVN